MTEPDLFLAAYQAQRRAAKAALAKAERQHAATRPAYARLKAITTEQLALETGTRA